MRHALRTLFLFIVLAPIGLGCGGGGSAAREPDPPDPDPQAPSYFPDWADVAPTTTVPLAHDGQLTDVQNGAVLAAAMRALTPGQRLEIGSGTYSIDSYYTLDIAGTALAPIWIVAAPGAAVVITRPNANQNVINVGVNAPTRYVCFRGLEITGGSSIVRLYDCAQVWVDGCHLHHGGNVCITANTRDTDHLYITRNEMHHGGGTAEGMYLGANNAAVVMRDSIVALNHVYECRGTQGDGIEVKQGSYGNWIVENHVHDCNYPCIIVYGTGGEAPNIVERNVCYNSADNVMQVQGEAIVRNNLLINGGQGFSSHDHQGQTVNLTVVHNTIINAGRAMNLSSWNGRAGMVLANNAVYSQTAESIRFPNGSTGVTIAGNVVVGTVVGASTGTTPGTGLGDFVDLAWDATRRDARPSDGSPLIGEGDPTHAVPEDISGTARIAPLDAGCSDDP